MMYDKKEIELKLLIFFVSQCCIQQFLGGAGFSTSVARRKTVVQLDSLGGAVSPPQWSLGTKPWKILAILHSE